MEQLHSLLRRQLKRTIGDVSTASPELRELLDMVDAAYRQFDDDRAMVERSLDLSSQELLQANHEITQALSLNTATLESTADAILVIDRAGKIVSFNQKFAKMWAVPASVVAGADRRAIHASIQRRVVNSRIFLQRIEALYGQPDAEFFDVFQVKDGRTFERYSQPQRIGGKSVGRVWSFRDITERKMTEEVVRQAEVLKQSEERFRALVQNGADLISVLNVDGTVRYQSPSAKRVLARDPQAIISRRFFEFLHPQDIPSAQVLIAEALGKPSEPITGELRAVSAGGETVYLEVIANNLLDNPGIEGILLTSRDITERKVLEGQLSHQAFHDPLTNLPNRALFMDRLDNSIERTNRVSGTLAVLFLDLDEFKVVNDTLGHEAGDRLLAEISLRLQDSLRQGDTVARLGGDEFTILLEGLVSLDEAIAVSDRISQRLRLPIDLGSRSIVVTGSIGIALSSPGQERPEDLLRNADIAMYFAKQQGKDRHAIYDVSMNARAWNRLELESDLRKAIERGEFRVVYQPMIELSSGHLREVEALIRWQHPRRGLVNPDDFIPLAEETGLILPIGKWVLQEACRQMQLWQAENPETAPGRVNVNVSGRQFRNVNLAQEVEEILRETGMPAERLELEITESVMMQDAEITSRTLGALKRLGVHLAIDDFGTGYSSLSSLKRLPIDTLKIDRSFVSGLGRDPEDHAIVLAIISLAQTLGISVVGEGIETALQLTQLQALGCERGQGFLFAKPLNVEDFNAEMTGNRMKYAA